MSTNSQDYETLKYQSDTNTSNDTNTLAATLINQQKIKIWF